ncbi:hypothetical protein PIB30_043696 [Stylosanthes scabra]|uniref:Uncharacterized protein n=1 Tax=Stylosanthes scabra TaxID=79078 RepID=A0ABU6SGA7_9FABA|nr:hypothetical protein [Stylosanthes scabra]
MEFTDLKTGGRGRGETGGGLRNRKRDGFDELKSGQIWRIRWQRHKEEERLGKKSNGQTRKNSGVGGGPTEDEEVVRGGWLCAGDGGGRGSSETREKGDKMG